MWFLLTIALSFSSEVCHVDFYDKSRMDNEPQVCQIKQSRGIASADAEDDFETRLLKFISSRVRTLDLNGDGKPDILRKKLANDNTEILHYREQKLFQRAVFNKFNDLIVEDVDNDLDGKFDQTYRCAGDTCTKKLQIKNGLEAYKIIRQKEKTLYRETFFARENGNLVKKGEKTYKRSKSYAKYEDELEKLKQEQTDRVRRFGVETEGYHQVCWDCYKRDYNAFTRLLEGYKAIKKPRRLQRRGDFIVSRVGVLIHKSCEEKYGKAFDVENQVTQAVVKGMSCFTDFLEKRPPWDRFGSSAFDKERVISYTNHIPRALNLFTSTFQKHPENYVCSNVLQDTYYTDIGAKEPCVDYNTPEFMVPKIICEDLLDAEQTGISRGSTFGYASMSAEDGSGVFVSGKNTVVLPHPYVSVMDSGLGDNRRDPVEFQETVWHELMHNMGYHGDNHPEHQMIHHCEKDCFRNAASRGQCFVNKKLDDFHDW